MSLKDNYIELSKKMGGPYSLITKGIKKGIVQSIMRGSIPKANELSKVAEVLGVTIEDLLSEDGAALEPGLMRSNISRGIKEFRDSLGLSQTELGEKIGVAGQKVSDYERGIILPASQTLLKLRTVLGCDLNWLLAGNTGQATAVGPKPVILTPEEENLVRLWRGARRNSRDIARYALAQNQLWSADQRKEVRIKLKKGGQSI